MDSDQKRSKGNWDAALGHALKNLPDRTAPATLLPRIMAEVHARTGERRNWRERHRLTFWAVAGVSALFFPLAAWSGGKIYEIRVSPVSDFCIGICKTVCGALASSLIGGNSMFDGDAYRFTLTTVGLLLIVMYITCIGLGSFVYRVVRR